MKSRVTVNVNVAMPAEASLAEVRSVLAAIERAVPPDNWGDVVIDWDAEIDHNCAYPVCTIYYEKEETADEYRLRRVAEVAALACTRQAQIAQLEAQLARLKS